MQFAPCMFNDHQPRAIIICFFNFQKREMYNLFTKTEKQTRNHMIANDLETLMTPDSG